MITKGRENILDYDKQVYKLYSYYSVLGRIKVSLNIHRRMKCYLKYPSIENN